jgi:hypothetical protein
MGKTKWHKICTFLGLGSINICHGWLARRAVERKGVYRVQVYYFARTPWNRQLLSDVKAGLDPHVVSFEQWNKRDVKDDDNSKLVAVFVLDIRTNKDPWSKDYSKQYSINFEGNFLGKEQWQWF